MIKLENYLDGLRIKNIQDILLKKIDNKISQLNKQIRLREKDLRTSLEEKYKINEMRESIEELENQIKEIKKKKELVIEEINYFYGTTYLGSPPDDPRDGSIIKQEMTNDKIIEDIEKDIKRVSSIKNKLEEIWILKDVEQLQEFYTEIISEVDLNDEKR